MKYIKFQIKGLTCDACVRLSKKCIGKISGVKEVRVSDINGDAEIFSSREIALDEIKDALSGTNYTVNIK